MKVGHIALTISFLAIISAGMFWRAGAQDEAFTRATRCVLETAQKEGYRGNPHSEEAWNLFISSCMATTT